jgi:hypothetical protein
MYRADGGVFRAPEKVQFSRRQDESTHIVGIGRLAKDRDTIRVSAKSTNMRTFAAHLKLAWIDQHRGAGGGDGMLLGSSLKAVIFVSSLQLSTWEREAFTTVHTVCGQRRIA